MESLGEFIKRTLKDKGIKEAYVAKRMNVSKQVINQIDRRKNFDYNLLSEISKASGIDFTQYISQPYLVQTEHSIVEEDTEKLNKLNNMPKLAYEFAIPEEAYGRIKAFQDDLLKLAEKHGMIIN